MFTNVKVHNMAGEFVCILCGESFRQAHACIELIDAASYDFKVRGDVCPACIEAGPEGAAERGHAYAHRLVSKAADLLELASAVRSLQSEQWADLDQLREAEREAHRQFLEDAPPAA